MLTPEAAATVKKTTDEFIAMMKARIPMTVDDVHEETNKFGIGIFNEYGVEGLDIAQKMITDLLIQEVVS